MEVRILELLDEGTLAPEQIAAHLGLDEAAVRVELDAMRRSGLVDVSTVTVVGNESRTSAAAYWRITHTGRVRLEQLRAGPPP
jgi:predicted ArsR family transcriptional regulator